MATGKIVLAGGSGQVGTILARAFQARGHEVVVLSRGQKKSAPWRTVRWDAKSLGDWVGELEGASAIVNLCGRSVNCRYTPANRQSIVDSRVEPTRLIGAAIAKTAHPPSLWMNASTATIYRHALVRPMDEATGELGGSEKDAPSTWRFSIGVAKAWEAAFFESPTPETRKIALRSAVVMSPDRGGAFDYLYTLVRAGLGGNAGSGDQYVSWVHETDFVGSLLFLFEHQEFEGCVNIASPNPIPNREFMRLLRTACAAPIGLPASRFLLEIGAWLIRTETELLLKSRRVIPGRLLDAGFTFNFPDWAAAAKDLVKKRGTDYPVPVRGNGAA